MGGYCNSPGNRKLVPVIVMEACSKVVSGADLENELMVAGGGEEKGKEKRQNPGGPKCVWRLGEVD